MFGIMLCVDTFNDCHHEFNYTKQKISLFFTKKKTKKKTHRFSLGLRSFVNIEFIDDFKNMKGMNTSKGQLEAVNR